MRIPSIVLFAVSQETATAVIAAAVIVLAFIALGIVGWVFWRAAKRDRAEQERAPDPVAGRAKLDPGSRSAQSSNGKESL
jgi:cbb3-type cytochrome oxidase subunit 3